MAWPTTSRHVRGYGWQWEKLRAFILSRDNHLCQACMADGRTTQGNQVDHIKPKAKGGIDDATNLQCLCGPCHEAKTTRESGGRVKVAIGVDGWPIQVEGG